jgi:hypothetical protein
MATSRRYAAGTQVPVSRSQDEIRGELRKLGADQIGVMEGGGRGFVVFKIRETLYRVASPEIEVKGRAEPEAESRRIWRAIVLLVKARSVAIREGITTVEREFLADAVMPDGTTFADHSPRLIEQAYKDNGPPRLLLLGAP